MIEIINGLQSEVNKLKEERDKIRYKMSFQTLSEDKKIELENRNKELSRLIENIDDKLFFFKISTCIHKIVKDPKTGISGCIKCGLNEGVWNKRENRKDEMMYDYLKRFERFIPGEDTGIKCDLNQAMNVYALLRDENKGATDDVVVSEFIKTMNNIQKKEDNPKTLKKTLNEPRSIWDWPL